MDCFKIDRALTEHYTRLRRRLHENAECAYQLERTVEIVTGELRALGIAYRIIGKGSIAARVGQGEYGVLLRADMDALHMKEETDLSFAPTDGRMHACGHDMHTAMLLFALNILKKKENDLAHEVRILFQAAEETLSGAADSIEAGILRPWDEVGMISCENDEKCKKLLSKAEKKPFIRAAYSLHSVVDVPIKCGTLIVPKGGVGAAASDFFRIDIEGRSSHGAVPHLGSDSLMALNSIYTALTTLAVRVAPRCDDALITVGRLSGGENANVICAHAEAEGTVRSYNDDTQRMLREQMATSTQQIGRAYGTEADLSFLGGAPTLKNDGDLASAAAHALRKIFPCGVLYADELSGSEVQRKSGGSEDFASFSHRIPSLLVGICAGDSREGYCYPLHHPKVRFDERALPIGALAYCALAHLSLPFGTVG